jgi:hypothetical protein
VALSRATFYDDNGVVRLQGQLDSGGGSSPVLSATATLTAADLTTLNTVAVQLVAAPGAGKIIMPLTAAAIYQAGGTVYDNTPNAKLSIGAGTVPSVPDYTWLQSTEAGAIFSQATSQVFFLGNTPTQTNYMTSAGAWDAADQFENLALVAYMLGGTIENAGADGTCKLWLSYVIADLA